MAGIFPVLIIFCEMLEAQLVEQFEKPVALPVSRLQVQLYVVPATVSVRSIAVVLLLHIVVFNGLAVTEGVGLTLMVKVIGSPSQIPKYGVTVIVAIFGTTELFVAEKDGISPFPEAPNPMEGSEFVQENATA